MKIAGIIPARYGSERFPGKPLAKIRGKPMIVHTMENSRTAQMLDAVIVATDDRRILEVVQEHGGTALLTPRNLNTGTERCAKTIEMTSTRYDAVINIQGDEPFIHHSHINTIASLLREGAEIATLAKKITSTQEFNSPDTVKVVRNLQQQALYFSRSPIPFMREKQTGSPVEACNFLKHIGIYGYQTDILKTLVSLPATALEKAEKLEQLRWLEHGFSIMVALTDIETKGIDTPEDLKNLKKQL